MNVAFHALGSFATAAVLSFDKSQNWRSLSALKKYVIGFVIGILAHGVFDFLPHNYPLPSKLDVVFAIFLLALMFFLTQKQNRLLVLVCFGGAIFPDVVDLSPDIARKYLGISLPRLSFKIFPWHWKEYSGSIYDGSRNIESLIYYSLVFLTSIVLIYFYRKKIFFANPS